MSHDRGCPCGKEFYEYEECKRSDCDRCPKKNDCNVVFDGISKHNGEYWYKCTTCGKSDWCASYDKFEQNEPLKDCTGTYKKEKKDMDRTFNSTKTQKQYVCIRSEHPPILLEGEDALIDSFNSNLRTDTDRYYELGAEVEIKVTVSVKNKPVYRDGATTGASGYRVPFENRD